MAFIYFKKKDLQKFESRLKSLALEKNYKFEKKENTLDKDEIVSQPTLISSGARELLKVFNDKATIVTYSLTHRKSNYFIAIGLPVGKDNMGVRISFDKKPFKQIAKGLIGFPLMVLSGPVGWVVGAGTLISSARRTFAIKGPLSKDINNIIETTLGEPIEKEI